MFIEDKIMIIGPEGKLISAEIDEATIAAGPEKVEVFELASYPWIDTKGETCFKWVRVGPIKTKVPYPCVYTKKCKKKLLLKVYYPEDVQGDIEETLKKCALETVLYVIPFAAPQFIAGDYAGSVSTAMGKFAEKFPECVGQELAGKVRTEFVEDKECGEWERV